MTFLGCDAVGVWGVLGPYLLLLAINKHKKHKNSRKPRIEVLVSTNITNSASLVITWRTPWNVVLCPDFPQPTSHREGVHSLFSRPCSSLALLPAFPRFLSKSCTFGAASSVPVLPRPSLPVLCHAPSCNEPSHMRAPSHLPQ